MNWIRVEPEEMTAAAGTLQRTSDELSGVNAGIRHDCSICLPTQAEVIADALIDVVDQILTIVTADLATKAIDLLTRGATAATDSLTVAAASTGPGMSLIGGSSFSSTDTGPISVLGGSLVGGPNTVISVPVPPNPFPLTHVGGPFAWSGPSPSESWTPIVSGRGGGLDPIGNPFIEPKPWEKLDKDLDGIPNGQDRHPNLDTKIDQDKDRLPDFLDDTDRDPTRD